MQKQRRTWKNRSLLAALMLFPINSGCREAARAFRQRQVNRLVHGMPSFHSSLPQRDLVTSLEEDIEAKSDAIAATRAEINALTLQNQADFFSLSCIHCLQQQTSSRSPASIAYDNSLLPALKHSLNVSTRPTRTNSSLCET